MTDRLSRDVLVAGAISALFVAVQIQASLNTGTLSFPPTYDDNGYFIDAVPRLQQLWSGGLPAVIRGYIATPPHAPGSSLLAMVGFAVFGVRPWAADAANAIPLFVFVLAILRLMSSIPLGVAAAAVAALLTIPIFGLAIVEFRPDMWCAGFTVLGTLLIALRDPSQPRAAALIGLVFAVTLLMKPTFSPLAVILYGAALLLRLAPTLRNRAAWIAALKAGLIIVGVALLLAGPHYVLGLKRLIDYYSIHVFGSGAAVWTPQLTPHKLAVYYLTGPGGQPSLGAWARVGMLFAATPLVLFAVRRRAAAWQAAIVLILAAIAYAVVTMGTIKSAYLGLVFTAYVAAGISLVAAYGLRELIQRGHRRAACALVALLLAFGATTYRFPWIMLHGTVYPPEFSASRAAINDQIAAVLAADPGLSKKTVMFAQITQYMNPETITFALMQRSTTLPQVVTEYFSDDMAKQEAMVARSHYVITMTPDYPSGVGWLPSAKIAPEINGLLGPQTGFELVKTIKPPNDPGEFRVYRRPTL